MIDGIISDIKLNYPSLGKNLTNISDKDNIIIRNILEDYRSILNLNTVNFIKLISKSFVKFTTEINYLQFLYNKTKSYPKIDFVKIKNDIYENDEYMFEYYMGVVASIFLWKSNYKLLQFFDKNFLAKYQSQYSNFVDLASGHFFYSAYAFRREFAVKNVKYFQLDIAPMAQYLIAKYCKKIELSNSVFQLGDLNSFENLRDIIPEYESSMIICNFVIEHLEDPQIFLKNLRKCIKSKDVLFISLAITAAQVDHIFEFKNEFEVIQLFERCGFLVESYRLFSIEYDISALKNNYVYPKEMSLIVRAGVL
jgi:hypothetical protein